MVDIWDVVRLVEIVLMVLLVATALATFGVPNGEATKVELMAAVGGAVGVNVGRGVAVGVGVGVSSPKHAVKSKIRVR